MLVPVANLVDKLTGCDGEISNPRSVIEFDQVLHVLVNAWGGAYNFLVNSTVYITIF